MMMMMMMMYSCDEMAAYSRYHPHMALLRSVPHIIPSMRALSCRHDEGAPWCLKRICFFKVHREKGLRGAEFAMAEIEQDFRDREVSCVLLLCLDTTAIFGNNCASTHTWNTWSINTDADDVNHTENGNTDE